MRFKNFILATVLLFSLIFGFILIFSPIASAQEVDQFGAFNYKYPIELPPGTNGMAPKLELVYNSNSGNGMLGMGWGLAGLPVICRDPSYGINYDNQDHYLYNGEKLIPGNDGYYHTERESFLRIEVGNLNSSSSYWIVTLKNGNKMYFGSSTDSHIDAVGKGGKAYLWALTKVVDLQGNYYEVEYNEDTANGDYYPIRIKYTKNDGHPLQAYRTVEFSYEDRNDHWSAYTFSAKVDINKRLEWITISTGGNLFKKYKLNYNYSSTTGKSKLISIQEFGNGDNFHEYSFEWQNGENVFTCSIWSPAGQGSNQMTGDFNGDGKTDFMQFTDAGWRVLLSTGSSFTPSIWSPAGQGSNQMTGDFNGDGKTDFMQFTDAGWRVLLSTGSSFTPGIWSPAGQGLNRMLGDFNGDGKTDFMQFIDSGWRVLSSSGAVNDLLIRIEYKFINSIIVISYLPTAQVSNVINSLGKNYPNIANRSMQPIVVKIINDNGLTLSHQIKTNYNYFNNRIHLGLPHDRANLGFEWIEKTDEATGSSVKTYYHQDDIDFRGLVKKEEIYGSDRKLYQVKEYRYAEQLIKDNSSSLEWHNIKFIYRTDDYLYNHNGEDDQPIEYRIEYRYDDNGNLIENINHGDTCVSSDDQRTVTEYTSNSTDYVTLPSVVRKYAVGLAGSEGLASETRFGYTNYLLTQKEFENESQDVTLTYGYDDYGNLSSETDGNGNTGTIAYDNIYHTFVKVITNALGHAKETVYDHLMRPIKTVDANGAVWETKYDEFSREKVTIAPGDDSVNPTIRKTYPDEFIDVQTGKPLFPSRMKTELKESGSNYLVKYEYYDGLGRVIQQKTEAENGWITIDRYYDNSGREYRISVPYLTTTYEYTNPDNTNKYTLKEFDPIGREITVRNTDGTIIRKVYGKLETLTIDPKGHVTGKRVNGNTEYQTSYTNVYPYHCEYSTTLVEKVWDGIRITDAVGNVLETRLDMLGRKVSYHDPDMGLWTYVYDANSNLTSQTDTKGQTIVMEYDAINRLVKKEYPDGSIVQFYYDEDGHGSAKGRLTRVVHPDGAESYNYDARGRQTSITQTIGGHSRTQNMTYDSMDRVLTTTYPDGEVVQSVYNQSGNLNNLSGNMTYVNGIDYTPYGKISKIQYGNGVQMVYNYYDQAGEYDNSAGTYHSYRLKQIQVSKAGGDIFNLGYEYDRAGNVKVKRDLNQSNFTEEYSYDDLNRLIGSGSPAYGYSLYRYDEINNILEKDLRTYQYSSTQPHAVTDDGQYTYTYDANGNMIGRSDGRIITWDYENRVKLISDGGSYAYDPSGRRIKKTENGVTTYYFFATYEEEYQDGTKTKSVKFYFAGDQRVAEYSSIEGLRYYHQDHLGSSVALTDITGALAFRANYTPYGSDAFTQGSTLIKYKFTGQEKDFSGLYYYGARYYDPELGRFISPDVNLDGLNRYTYCHNNPVIYNDPTGEWAWVIGAIIGAYTGHKVAESKGIEVDTSDWYKHVVTGAVIGGVAGWAADKVAVSCAELMEFNLTAPLATTTATQVGLAYAAGGAVGGFISGFGNSWAFGGEGTDLFKGDISDALRMGLNNSSVGAVLNFGLGYCSIAYPELITKFKEQCAKQIKSLGIPIYSDANGTVTGAIGKYFWKYIEKGFNENFKKYLMESSYNFTTVINAMVISGRDNIMININNSGNKVNLGLKWGAIFKSKYIDIIWEPKTRESLKDAKLIDFSQYNIVL